MAEIITEVVTTFTLHLTAEEMQHIEYALWLCYDDRYESDELYSVVSHAMRDNGIDELRINAPKRS